MAEPTSHSPEPFDISGKGIMTVASVGQITVSFAGSGDATMSRRRPQRVNAQGVTEYAETLVADLDGVRTYVQRQASGHLDIVITRLNLLP